jgi:beta-phosphoglucomutase family hydrolase
MKQLNLEGTEGVLFDMDGTMVHNQPYHFKAWQEFAKRHGFTLTEEEIKSKTSGKKNSQILPILLQRDVSDEELKQLADEKEEIYRELYASNVVPIDGLPELVKKLQEKGIKVAVATTAQKKNREFVLGELGLDEHIDVIVGEEHFTHGKPDPELFLTAADRLGVTPEHCLVFDDAPIGVPTARAAGMKIVGVLTTHDEDEFKGAELTINNFTELDI